MCELHRDCRRQKRDVLEVDAASRTKVEDTRDLLDNVQYAPTRSRFKIYLIDEVHMLSNHSFNALLKTLEEPPEHVKFLLATTDPQKLPATVLSRCLQFNLKNMVPRQIIDHLRHVLAEESVGFDDESLALLARGAEGSMRDALSLTDQAIAHGSGKLAADEVRQMLGTVSRTKVFDLLDAIVANDPKLALAVVEDITSHSPDYAGTLDELASVLHQISLAQAVPGSVDSTLPEHERLASLAGSMTADDAHLWWQMAVAAKRELYLASDPRAGLDMAVLRMIAFRPAVVLTDASEVPPAKKPEPPVMPVEPATTSSNNRVFHRIDLITTLQAPIKWPSSRKLSRQIECLSQRPASLPQKISRAQWKLLIDPHTQRSMRQRKLQQASLRWGLPTVSAMAVRFRPLLSLRSLMEPSHRMRICQPMDRGPTFSKGWGSKA